MPHRFFYRAVVPSASCFWEAPIFRALRPLILASASPRRIDFLRSLGLSPAVVLPPEGTEPAAHGGEDPEAFALRAATAKAAGALAPACAAFPPQSSSLSGLIIAADTIVVLGNSILGKPRDSAEAFAMLSSLAGKTHDVVTACAFLSLDFAEPPIPPFAVRSRVSMWDCPSDLIKAYACSGEPMDKAGAYAVQGAGAFLVHSIEGSWSNVVGLPLAEIVQILVAAKAVEAVSSAG